jgi:hypothetical protein
MLVTTATFTRPSTSVAFYSTSEAFNNSFNAEFISTGKLLEKTSTGSEDGLTYTLVSKYKSKADFDEFLANADGIAMKEARLLYCVANNITIDYAGELIHDANDPIPQ